LARAGVGIADSGSTALDATPDISALRDKLSIASSHGFGFATKTVGKALQNLPPMAMRQAGSPVSGPPPAREIDPRQPISSRLSNVKSD
jgi:hypothetical protein